MQTNLAYTNLKIKKQYPVKSMHFLRQILFISFAPRFWKKQCYVNSKKKGFIATGKKSARFTFVWL